MKSTSSRNHLATGVLALVIALAANLALAAPSGYHFRVLDSIGDSAPGGGAFVNDFEPTALNNLGQLAFTAEPVAPGEEAIWLTGFGTVTRIARFGLPAPGGGFFGTGEMGNIGLNDAGDLTFAFTLGNPPDFTPDFGPPIVGGVFRWSHLTRTVSAVVVPNVTPVPGGGLFRGVHFHTSLNLFGTVAFTGFVDTLAGPSFGTYIQDRHGHFQAIAQPGDSAPGGGTFITAGNPAVINNAGDVIFEGHTTVDPDADTNDVFVKHAGTGRMELIPRPSGVVQEANLQINNFGRIAFGGSAAPFPTDIGIGSVFVRQRGRTTVVASTGSPAPGGGHFSNIPAASLSGQLSMNDWGDVAFEAATDTGDEAMYLYSGRTGELSRVAGIGDVIPGAGTIVSLEQVGSVITPPPPVLGFPLSNAALNDWGQISFVVTVNNGGTARGALLLATPEVWEIW